MKTFLLSARNVVCLFVCLFFWITVTACGAQSHHAMHADARSVPPPPVPEASALAAAPSALAEAATPTLPRLVISELQTDPLLRDESAGDYLEVVNLAPFPVRLSDLALQVPSGKRLVPERPGRPWLDPGEVSVWQALEEAGRVRVRGLRLPNQAGRIEILWRGRVVETSQWLRKRPWPRVKPGVAWERTDPRLDGAQPQAWRPATRTQHGVEKGSPGVVQWPCIAVQGTPLAATCTPAPTAPQRRRGCT